MSVCLGCCLQLSSSGAGTRKRRLLEGHAVYTQLRDVVNNIDSSCDADKLIHDNSFMCRGCFGKFERMVKLRNEVIVGVQKAVNIVLGGNTESVVDLESIEPLAESLHGMKRPRLEISTSKSPSVSVTVSYPSKPKNFTITPSRRKLCKQLARRQHKGTAKQCLSHNLIRQNVVKEMGKIVQKEIALLCSDKVTSVLQDRSGTELLEFSWERIHRELEEYTPNLLTLLKWCTKTRTTRNDRPRVAVICLCISMLCKFRNSRMSLTQKVLSLLLYAGHASKQLYTRLGKLMLTVSDRTVVSLLEKLGRNYDFTVCQWRDNLDKNINHGHDITKIYTTGICQFLCDDVETTSAVSSSDSYISEDETLSMSSDDDIVTPPEYSPVSSPEPDEMQPHDLQQQPDDQPPLNSQDYPHTCIANSPEWNGFKLVGDNVDKNVKPRFIRMEYQTQSLHYFHMYAIKDRINLSAYSDSQESVLPDDINPLSLLPSPDDYEALMNNFAILLSRCLVQHCPYFQKTFSDVVQNHIYHKYSTEMSMLSEVVPLGVLPKNENVHEEMVDIMDHLHRYVPVHRSSDRITVPSSDEEIEVVTDQFHSVIFGGDQLTVARARGAQKIQMNAKTPTERLLGLVPAIEDWHSKVCLLGVIWKRLYVTSSGTDFGTLYHIRNLVNRRNVNADPCKNVNSSEDFFLMVVHSHIIAASMQNLGMDSPNATPSTQLLSDDVWLQDADERMKLLKTICRLIVCKYVDLTIQIPDKSNQSTNVPTHSYTDDSVNNYAREVISLGLLYMEFVDSVREGDGERLLRCWKFLLPIFKASKRTNYSLEALNLLTQYESLSPRLSQQLIWSRFVNNHGCLGMNVSLDLHIEHLNAVLKTAVNGLGANRSKESIIRLGKCIGPLHLLLSNFDEENNISHNYGRHSQISFAKDLSRVVSLLTTMKVFQYMPKCTHRKLAILSPLTHELNDDFIEWMKVNIPRSFYPPP